MKLQAEISIHQHQPSDLPYGIPQHTTSDFVEIDDSDDLGLVKAEVEALTQVLVKVADAQRTPSHRNTFLKGLDDAVRKAQVRSLEEG